MPKINKPIINYTGRDFATIKQQLVDYAQKYYPETFRDFNEASFGSLMLDLVSYVGDIVSFYTDYQANESFLETALEYNNVLKLARQMGFKYRPNASSFGDVSFFITVPSRANSVAPDLDYAPILQKGSTFVSSNNTLFTLIEDVDFSTTQDQIEVGATNFDGTAPTKFALKTKGVVVSGELFVEEFTVDKYQKFLQLDIQDPNVTEVISVIDSEGNNYYEVDYLTQDVIYVPILNTNSNRRFAKNILKPIAVPRRFVTEHNISSTKLQFGFGTADNEQKVLDPTSVILDIFGKNYITDKSFDPNVLTKTSKLGIVPSNTVLTVLYRRNSSKDINIPPGSLTNLSSPLFKFLNRANLSEASINSTVGSLELTNEQAITGDVSDITSQELKLRAQSTYASQNRAVTKDDYISLVYNMPSNFGKVTRAMITRDQTSFNGKNLNLFVISSDSDGLLTTTNDIIKQNLKIWLNRYKMLGDTLDILDAKIINLKIDFTVVGSANINKYDIVSDCISTLNSFYANNYFEIGEPFKITDVYRLLNGIPTVVDTKNVSVDVRTGIDYSGFTMPFEELISNDGRYLIPPEDAVFEIKFPTVDITGEIA
jgi:hypothetical protein